ncbi:MAG TPA: hypothetical protein VF210_21620 [Pseudomonadales bacterium]
MTTEPHDPALDGAVRDALRAQHARQRVPAFDELWSAAQARQREESGAGAARPAAARVRHWPALATAAAVALVVGVTLIRSVERPPEHVAEEAHPATAAAVEQEPFPPPEPVMWYAPTDALLQIPALRYSAQPASLTYYDPIHLEVRE